MRSSIHSGVFKSYLQQLDDAVADLHQRRTLSIDQRVKYWMSAWENALAGVIEVEPSDLLRYGLLLGRVAESYSFNVVAENVMDQLADAAIRREPWVPDPPSVLITAGEFNRRRGNRDRAEERFGEAIQILEKDIAAAEDRQRVHKELGRLFYELGYLQRLRGDAGAARAALERSEVECELAGDGVGAEIARSVLAAISYEEGLAEAAVAQYKASLAQFVRMVDDPEVRAAGRSGLARRWIFNARVHLAQAYLAAGNHQAARRELDTQLAEQDQEPSTLGLATLKRVEAQLLLAEDDLGSAEAAIAASRQALDTQGDLKTVDMAAATVAITGVIRALTESHASAQSCFEEACQLPPELYNYRGQAWACAGRAILAREAGDADAALRAIGEGLDKVQRGGAPIRSFLLQLLRTAYATETAPGLRDLKVLVYSTG